MLIQHYRGNEDFSIYPKLTQKIQNHHVFPQILEITSLAYVSVSLYVSGPVSDVSKMGVLMSIRIVNRNLYIQYFHLFFPPIEIITT